MHHFHCSRDRTAAVFSLQVDAFLGDRQLAHETRVLLLQRLNAPFVRTLARGGSRLVLSRYALLCTLSAPLLKLTAVELLAPQQRAELAAPAGAASSRIRNFSAVLKRRRVRFSKWGGGVTSLFGTAPGGLGIALTPTFETLKSAVTSDRDCMEAG
jgi:hypothetical protein